MVEVGGGLEADGLEQVAFGAGVQGGGGLVEDDEGGVPEERAGQRDALALADGQVVAAGESGPGMVCRSRRAGRPTRGPGAREGLHAGAVNVGLAAASAFQGAVAVGAGVQMPGVVLAGDRPADGAHPAVGGFAALGA
jgi:hypothetical protein